MTSQHEPALICCVEPGVGLSLDVIAASPSNGDNGYGKWTASLKRVSEPTPDCTSDK